MDSRSQQWEIRRVQVEDAQAMLDYLEVVSAESDNLTFGPGEFGMSLEQEVLFLEAAIKQERTLFLIAIAEGEIVGNLTFHSGKRPRIAHLGELGITVRQKWWGQGIARQLIQELIQWSGQNGIRKINLRVRSDNERAIRLYLRLGFQVEGKLTRDLRIDGCFYDALAMGLQVDPESEQEPASWGTPIDRE